MTARARVAPGLRRLAPKSVQIKTQTDRFVGLPDGVSIGQLLAAFKRAAAPMGLAGVRDLLDQLHAFSRAEDWQTGCRPIVWPSNATLAERLGVCRRHVRRLLARLVEAGIIVAVDSPEGRRWGRRDSSGRIVEAYGFDLSPLADRYEEFLNIAAQAETERKTRQALRRRLTIARKAIQQITETALDHGVDADADDGAIDRIRDWRSWLAHALRLAAEATEEGLSLQALEEIVVRLEEQRQKAEAQLVRALDAVKESSAEDSGVRPHTTTTQPRSNPCNKASRKEGNGPGSPDDVTDEGAPPDEPPAATPRFVLRVSPPLRAHVATPKPTWSEIVEAADRLRHQLGISRSAWIEACEVLGRYQAAVAVAVIAAKCETIRSPGGYLRGMTARARDGELYLLHSLYGLAGVAPRGDAAHRQGVYAHPHGAA